MKRKVILLLAVLSLSASAARAGGPESPGDSGFELRFDGGLVSPVSGDLHNYFNPSYAFGGAVGYRFGALSLLLDTQYNNLELDNEPSSDNFGSWEWALLEKVSFGGLTSIRPFLFLGEGLALTSFSFAGNTVNRTDPLLEGGVGLDFKANDRISIFLQTKASFVLTSDQATSPDKVSIYIPIQAGMDFAL